jgi:capsular polysaccharide biosynthesis protein/Mrp family chromosome partitioning ATPase
MGSSTAHVPAADGFADYLGMVRRGWPVIVVGAVLGLLGAVGYLQVQQDQYMSVASVLVSPTGVQNTADLANGRTNSEINLDTEARLVRSTEVASRSRDLMKSDAEPGELASAVAVSVPPNTEVLSISFTGGTPADAQQGAHAFAQAYLASRTASAQASLNGQMSAIRTQQTSTLRGLRTVVETLADLPNGSAERAYYSAQRDLLTQQLQSLNQLMGKLTTTVVTPGRVLNDAELPARAAGPAPWMIFVAGLSVGLVAGLAVAALRMRTDRRVRSVRDIEQHFGLAVIGEPGPVDLLVPAEPGSIRFEAFRRVLNGLPVKPSGTPVTVLVVGAAQTAVPAAVAANLALAQHHNGRRVLLVSADPNDHTAERLVGAPHVRPLAEEPGTDQLPVVLAEDPELGIVSQILPALGAPAGLLTVGSAGLLRKLSEGYDTVIVVVSATDASADAQSLAPLTDVVLLVTEPKLTTRAQLEDARHQFEEINVPVHGVVLARANRKQRTASADVAAPDTAAADPDSTATTEITALPAEADPSDERARSGEAGLSTETTRSGEVVQSGATKSSVAPWFGEGADSGAARSSEDVAAFKADAPLVEDSLDAEFEGLVPDRHHHRPDRQTPDRTHPAADRTTDTDDEAPDRSVPADPSVTVPRG